MALQICNNNKVTKMEEKHLIFIKSNKNKQAVIYGNYKYNHTADNKNGSSFWRCNKRGECSASITINQERNLVLRETVHFCEADECKILKNIVVDKAKISVCENMKSIKRNYEESLEDLDNQPVSTKLKTTMKPCFKTVKDTLNRARLRFLNVKRTEYSSSVDVEIPPIISNMFMVSEQKIDEDNKLILFCSQENREVLQSFADQNHFFFGDGTFKRAPTPFYQLFTIHVDVGSCDSSTNVIPVIYALLPNKCENTYYALFSLIRDEMGINIRCYKCDFEMAQINAVKSIYPNASVTGCYFHYIKNVWKKAVELNFPSTAGRKNIVRMAANLPLLPTNLIVNGWQSIVAEAPSCEEFENFKTYMEKYWLKNPAMISCCRQRHRTTNALEAWHRRLNIRMQHKPTLILFLYLLKKEAKFQNLKVTHSIFESGNRKKADIIFDRKYHLEINSLNNGDINVIQFLKNISTIKYRLKFI